MTATWLFNFPVPPSDNALYRNVRGIGRVKSSAYLTWKKELKFWALQNRKQLATLKDFCELKPLLNVHLLLKMPPERFWTKKKTVKKLDASNRLKASLDGLSELIGLDDSHFWCVSIQKVTHLSECLDILVQTHTIVEA